VGVDLEVGHDTNVTEGVMAAAAVEHSSDGEAYVVAVVVLTAASILDHGYVTGHLHGTHQKIPQVGILQKLCAPPA